MRIKWVGQHTIIGSHQFQNGKVYIVDNDFGLSVCAHNFELIEEILEEIDPDGDDS